MSRRYHINPAVGVPSICRAEMGKCPFGGESGNDNHYYSYSEAQKRSQELFEESYRILPQNQEDPMEVLKRIEARREVSEETRQDLPQEEYEATKELRFTDDVSVIMGTIEGDIYEDSGWRYVSIALQNPNVPKAFRDDVLFNHPKEFHEHTRHWMALNHGLKHEELKSIIENENEDMTVRLLAVKNKNVDREYLRNIIENDFEKAKEPPYSMIHFTDLKTEESRNHYMRGVILARIRADGFIAAEDITRRYPFWEMRYRKRIAAEKENES